jgi:hypothetical protein
MTNFYCPSCGSQNVSTRYCCPYCKSFNIQKGSLIEHVKCGYMDVEENFRKGEKLVCPKCHEELKKPDVDYKRLEYGARAKTAAKTLTYRLQGISAETAKQNSHLKKLRLKMYTLTR